MQLPRGPIEYSFHFIIGVGNGIDTFNFSLVIHLFEILKMLYPPKGLCKANTEGGPIVFTYVLLG